MAKDKWFRSIESTFYDALEYHAVPEWIIKPMPPKVNTCRDALDGQKERWPFRTHNAKGK